MASRVSPRQWFFRDLPQGYKLLVFSILIVAILTYCIDWSTAWHGTKKVRVEANDEQNYSGSIVIPSDENDGCHWLSLDNRTGQLRDEGYKKCETSRYSSIRTPQGKRLIEIGKTFRQAE